MLATKITTHVPDAIARLLSQYTGSPRMVGLLAALVNEVQALEEAIFNLDDARSLFGHPVGVQLDRIGELVGVGRNGLSDATYLSVLRGVIAENYSDGTAATLVAAAAALFQAQAVFRKDVNSIGPWPGLAAVGGTPSVPWSMPPGTIASHMTSSVTAGSSGGFFITTGSGASFPGGGNYLVMDPGGPTQEAFIYYTASGDSLYNGSPFTYSHAIGTLVIDWSSMLPLPGPTPGTPPTLQVRATSGDMSAEIALGIGSPQISPDDYRVVLDMLLRSLPAGVGVFYVSLFNAAGAFACAGPQSWPMGWADVNIPGSGGPMADLLYNNPSL